MERLLPEGSPAPGDPEWERAWRRHEAAVAERVQAFAGARPENLLWGSDWPHVGLQLPAPASAETLARLRRWLPDQALQQQILVDNPERRYDFAQNGRR
jgi:2-pyrone-4,6-dicarboxylate lactonase